MKREGKRTRPGEGWRTRAGREAGPTRARWRRWAPLAAALAVWALLGLPSASAQFFEVVPIEQGDQPALFLDVRGVKVNAINDVGQAVGRATFEYPDATVSHAFVWDAESGFTDLGDLDDGLQDSEALDINNFGAIVGWSCVMEPGLGGRDVCQRRAFISESGVSMGELEADFVLQEEKEAIMTDKIRDFDGWNRTQSDHVAASININGEVVGYRDQRGIKVPMSIFRWFRFNGASLWSGGHVDLNGDFAASRAAFVNDRGDITGVYYMEPPECPPSFAPSCINTVGIGRRFVLWSEGAAPIDLSEISNFTPFLSSERVNGLGALINNRREIPGRTDDDVFGLWTPGAGIRPIPELEDSFRDLNNLGQVLGERALWLPEPALGLEAGIHDLGEIVLGRERPFREARQIGDTGYILATATKPEGGTGPVLLVPAEPNDIDPFAAVTLSSGNFPWAGEAGDPVNTFTGEFTRTLPPDLDLGGPLPLRFRRYYGSLLRRDRKIEGSLGDNWLRNFDWRLHRDGDKAVIVNWKGAVIRFRRAEGGWLLEQTPDVPFQLVEGEEGAFVLGDPRRERIYRFDAGGRLAEIADRAGNALALAYEEGRLAQASDGLGRVLSFAYDEGGLLESVSDGTRTVSFFYQASGPLRGLAGFKDATGELQFYRPRLESLQDGFQASQFFKAAVLFLEHDAQGRVARQTLREPHGVYRFEYGEDGVTTITDPQGDARRHVHDSQGRLLRTEDEAGVREIGSGEGGRRESVESRDEAATRIAYHEPTGKIAAVTYPDGTELRYTYEEAAQDGLVFYNVTETRYPDGSAERYAYDDAGNLVSLTDRAGRTGTFAYNERGQQTRATNPAGGTTTLAYNEDGTLASREDPMGRVTKFEYDDLRRRTRIVHPDGSVRSFAYDAADRLVSWTDERGNETAFQYEALDVNPHLLTVTDPLGAATEFWFGYSFGDKLLAIVDPTGANTRIRYDAMGRPESVEDPNGNETRYAYDGLGRMVYVEDPSGEVWERAYDADGRLVAAANPLGGETRYEYDARGRVDRVTSPAGSATRIGYDGLGRITALENDDDRSTAFAHDALGAPVEARVASSGGATTIERDALGLPTKLTDALGNAWSYAYDASGAPVRITDPLGQVTNITYDARGRAVEIDGPSGKLTTTYDAASNVTRRVYEGGPTLDYAYDAAGRLVSATGVDLERDERGALVGVNGLAAERDAGGRIVSIALAEGKTVAYSYDSRDLPTQVSDWMGGEVALAYDAAGRLVSIGRPNGVTTLYEYNADNRVVGIEEKRGDAAIASLSLVRDRGGKIVSAERDTPQAPEPERGAVRRAVGAGHRIEGFGYDEAGRRVEDDRRNYQWDAAGRLVGYAEGERSVSLAYDAFGNLLRREESGVAREFVQNYALGLPSISVEREGGTDARYYVHTPGGSLLYRIEAEGSRQYYHYDEQGNTLFLTDDSGEVVQAYAYSPYGRILGASGSVENAFAFGGQFGARREGEDLYQMRARYYDSRARRFISRDPAGVLRHPQLVNPYQYAVQNPLRFFDVTGAFPSEALASGSDAVGSLEGGRLDQATSAAASASFPSTLTTVSSSGMVLAKGSFRLDPPGGEPGGLARAFKNAATQREADALATAFVGNRGRAADMLDESLRLEIRSDQAKGVGKWAGRVGNAATAAGIINETFATASRVEAARREATGAQDASLSALDRQLAELKRLVDEKLVSPERERELFSAIMDAYQARQDAEFGTESVFGIDVSRRDIGILTESAIGFKNMLGNLVPDPFGWSQGDPLEGAR